MPRPQVSEAQRAQTRRKIRQAAARVYQAAGIKGVSARAIAKEAGVSVGTLYSYFANLHDLMESLWREPVDRASDELKALAARTPDPLTRIRVLLESYIGFALDNPEIYRAVFLFVRPPDMVESNPLPVREVVLPALLIEAIREGQARGEIRKGDPELMAQALWASVHGAIALPANMGRFALSPAEDIARTALDIALRGLRAD